MNHSERRDLSTTTNSRLQRLTTQALKLFKKRYEEMLEILELLENPELGDKSFRKFKK